MEISIEGIFRAVAGDEAGDVRGVHYPNQIAAALGVPHDDPRLDEMIKSMVVAGYLRRGQFHSVSPGPRVPSSEATPRTGTTTHPEPAPAPASAAGPAGEPTRTADRPAPAGAPLAGMLQAPIVDKDGTVLQPGDRVWSGSALPVLARGAARQADNAASCAPANVPLQAYSGRVVAVAGSSVVKADHSQTELNYTSCSQCGFVHGPTNVVLYHCPACGADDGALHDAYPSQQAPMDWLASRLLQGPIDPEQLAELLDGLKRHDLDDLAARLQNQTPWSDLTGTTDAIAQAIAQHDMKKAATAQAAADRRFAAELEQSEKDGNLIQHEPKDACTFGFWHEGLCWPPKPGQHLTATDGATISVARTSSGNGARLECSDAKHSYDDPDPEWVVAEAHRHWNWHNAEGAVDAVRRGDATEQQREMAAERLAKLDRQWMKNWPAPDGKTWVDWTDELRVCPEADGYQVLDEAGNVKHVIRPAIDGSPDWLLYGPDESGEPVRKPTAHQALLDAVDGRPDPLALRTPTAPYTREQLYQDLQQGWCDQKELAHRMGVDNDHLLTTMLEQMTADGQVVRTTRGRLAAGTSPKPQRMAPAGVPAAARPQVHVDPAWLTGVDDEDQLVKRGKCPYETVPGGWGGTQQFCGNERSPNPNDHPHCGPHALEIRLNEGRSY